MERSRSKRHFYSYDDDYDSESLPRTRQRYRSYSHSHSHSHSHSNHHYHSKNNYRRSAGRKPFDPAIMVTTSFKILCHDSRAGGVIGKSGSIIKAIRQHTGARINVHDLIPGDHEHIIEISDTRRRDPEGRMPAFSPSQEALLLIHERILDCGGGNRAYNEISGISEDDDESGRGGAGGGGNHYSDMNSSNRVVTRLVVSRLNVGSLLGRGGKIIEQMRIASKAHIRVLTRDHVLPRCVLTSEEIVQVVGEMDSVKDAVEIISLRLRESQHRDRSQCRGRQYSPEQFVDGDLIHLRNTRTRRSSTRRLPAGLSSSRSNKYSSRSSGYAGVVPIIENIEYISNEELVFRILCPVDKVNVVIGESEGIIELLQNEIGVDVKVADHIPASNEQIIIISSDEGPDDELFPAQEALLHIQTRIVDLVPEKENIITTRLLVQADEMKYLEGKDGLSVEMRKISGAKVHILHGEELPVCASECDKIVEIVGDIRAAREALIEVTSRLRSYAFGEFMQEEASQFPVSALSPVRSHMTLDANSGYDITPSLKMYVGSDSTTSSRHNSPDVGTTQPPKGHLFDLNTCAVVEELDCGSDTWDSQSEAIKQEKNEHWKSMESEVNRLSVPLVSRSTLDVVIPPHAACKLITKSRNKLAQIVKLSGANVKLNEESLEEMEKIIQISGTPEQTERAQSLLQGFILSTQEDNP